MTDVMLVVLALVALQRITIVTDFTLIVVFQDHTSGVITVRAENEVDARRMAIHFYMSKDLPLRAIRQPINN